MVLSEDHHRQCGWWTLWRWRYIETKTDTKREKERKEETKNLKSNNSSVTESGKRVGELGFQPCSAGPRPVEGLVIAWKRGGGGGLGGDERGSHALEAPGE